MNYHGFAEAFQRRQCNVLVGNALGAVDQTTHVSWRAVFLAHHRTSFICVLVKSSVVINSDSFHYWYQSRFENTLVFNYFMIGADKLWLTYSCVVLHLKTYITGKISWCRFLGELNLYLADFSSDIRVIQYANIQQVQFQRYHVQECRI